MHTRELFSLSDRVAIVTGGRGLYGASISRGLAEMGATVVVASRNGKACEDFAAELCKENVQAIGLTLDLGNDASIRSFVDEVICRYGHIDILVNNATNNNSVFLVLVIASKDLLMSSLSTLPANGGLAKQSVYFSVSLLLDDRLSRYATSGSSTP